jgi:hypothetical protein
VKARTNGPAAKSFNLNFSRSYDKIDEQDPRPGNLFGADDEARTLGAADPRRGLRSDLRGHARNARALEDFLAVAAANLSDGGQLLLPVVLASLVRRDGHRGPRR